MNKKAICDNCDKEFDLEKQGFQGHGYSKYPSNPSRIKSWCSRKCYNNYVKKHTSWYEIEEGTPGDGL